MLRSQTSSAAKNSTAAKDKTPIFVRLEKTGLPTSYLFGTHHQATFKNCSFQPEASEGFQRATHVLSEVAEAAIESNITYEKLLKLQNTLSTIDYTSLLRPIEGENLNVARIKTELYKKLVTFFKQYPWKILPASSKQKQENYIQGDDLIGMPVGTLLESIEFLLNRQLKHRWYSKLSLWFSPTYFFYSLLFHYSKYAYQKMLAKPKRNENNDVAQSDPHYETAMDARLTLLAMQQHKQLLPLESTENQQAILDQLFQNTETKRLMALASDDEREKEILQNHLIRLSSVLNDLNTHPKPCLISIRWALTNGYFYKTSTRSGLDKRTDEYNAQSMEEDDDDPLQFGVRNKKWLPTLLTTLQQHSSFIFVGVGHLGYVGNKEEGLIALLRKEGFTVTPIECPQFQAPSLQSKLADALSAGAAKEEKRALPSSAPALTPAFNANSNEDSSSSKHSPSPAPEHVAAQKQPIATRPCHS